ncbi:MAG: hypothetical protein IKV61_00430, partial [Clostridia bacterium]|nr:hypothetical protein [Clostridia bacterium]
MLYEGGVTALLALPAFLTSNYAVLGYILIILFSLLVLIITLMVREGSKSNTECKIIGEIETDVKVEANSTTVQETPNKKEKKKLNEQRFCMLNDIERNKSKLERVNYDKNVTLDEICDDFRSYASSKLKLYYDISDIRRFIAGMAVSHILILQGM